MVSQISHVASNVYTSNTLHMYICIRIHTYAVSCMYILIQTSFVRLHTYIYFICTYMYTG